MSALLHRYRLKEEIGDFIEILCYRIDLVFTRLQFLEGEITIRTDAGVVERNVLTHPTDIDAMFAGPSFTLITTIMEISSMYSAFHDRSSVRLAIVNVKCRHLNHSPTR